MIWIGEPAFGFGAFTWSGTLPPGAAGCPLIEVPARVIV